MAAAYEYAIVRVVPDVARDEFLNVGVALFCEERQILVVRLELDEDRLRALAPALDLTVVRPHLDALPRIAKGGDGAGPIGQLPLRERWRWLVAPRSTMIQTSPPHGGVCDAPEAVLEHLLTRMVRSP